MPRLLSLLVAAAYVAATGHVVLDLWRLARSRALNVETSTAFPVDRAGRDRIDLDDGPRAFIGQHGAIAGADP